LNQQKMDFLRHWLMLHDKSHQIQAAFQDQHHHQAVRDLDILAQSRVPHNKDDIFARGAFQPEQVGGSGQGYIA
jgi:hypothetical protein